MGDWWHSDKYCTQTILKVPILEFGQCKFVFLNLFTSGIECQQSDTFAALSNPYIIWFLNLRLRLSVLLKLGHRKALIII